MKTEDYDKLKKLCDENGFELLTESPKENDKFFVVKKKDIWEGVEFAECVDNGLLSNSLDIGRIYKVREISLNQAIGIEGMWGGYNRHHFKPSTEQAYIEQLKRIANEKFGDIKEGDRFDIVGGGERTVSKNNTLQWEYFKGFDQLFYHNVEIYQQGKWATKLPERVKVEFIDYHAIDQKYTFKFKIIGEFHSIHHYGDTLAKYIENYINDTNNNQD
jgi:hypothetical protein